MVTAGVLCQREGGADCLVVVFVADDGEEDALHGGAVGEGAHGPGSPPHLAEAAFDGVGSAQGPALAGGLVVEASEQLVEVLAQAGDGLGIARVPALGEAPGGGTRRRYVAGVHDGVQAGLDGGLVCGLHLAQDVADLVHPAALHGDAGIDHGEGGQ